MILPTWIQALFDVAARRPRSVSYAVLSAHFQLLSLLCQSSQSTIADAVSNIKSSQLVSSTLLDAGDLSDRTQSLFKQVQLQEFSSFKRDLTTIRDITLGNQLMSAFGTGWDIIADSQETDGIFAVPRVYGNVFYIIGIF